MELDNGPGAARRIEKDEVEMAAAVFLFVHRECGEAAQVYPAEGMLICHCELCKESRVYTYELDGL